MDTSKFKNLLLHRQSCRSFSDEKVTREEIKELCALSVLSPSACNFQPWKIYAVAGDKLSAVKAALLACGKAPFVENAPAFLAIAVDPTTSAERPDVSYYAPYDVGELTAHVVLTAQVMGLDSCILGVRNDSALRELFEIPETETLPYLIAVGHASEGYPTREKKRRPLDETFSFVD